MTSQAIKFWFNLVELSSVSAPNLTITSLSLFPHLPAGALGNLIDTFRQLQNVSKDGLEEVKNALETAYGESLDGLQTAVVASKEQLSFAFDSVKQKLEEDVGEEVGSILDQLEDLGAPSIDEAFKTNFNGFTEAVSCINGTKEVAPGVLAPTSLRLHKVFSSEAELH
jgi:hypothetical protein